ncbi:endonuclease/exonuclease/phosphatase family protein [Pustulibacterium marinum]|nr:endonuclease/exonuclease/phosphatase family protein [Pustulibacterium marinum]
MTWNVRMLNQLDWTNQTDIPQKIQQLVAKENPDIMMFQEFWKEDFKLFEKMYPYYYVKCKNIDGQMGQVILSRYEILSQGIFNFDSGNDILYADLDIHGEKVRVYNFHLQSLGINSTVEGQSVKQIDKKWVAKSMSKNFTLQQSQIEEFISNVKEYGGRFVICGDFNNTAFSYIYRRLKTEFDLKDSFEERGSGFGRSYDFKYFPMRIDFVFGDKEFEVRSHENFSEYYSDHFPVKVVFGMHDPEND